MEKKIEDVEKDDIERYIQAESEKTSKELEEIKEELKKLTERLSEYISFLDSEIKLAFEMGDDKLWISLTNKRAIILQRLTEIAQILHK